MENKPVYMDSYTLQADSRIRLPKSVIANIHATPGETRFAIYFDNAEGVIILKPDVIKEKSEEKKNG